MIKQGITFDDVLIQPSWSDINSRDDISLSQTLWTKEFGMPIISAPMDYVTGYDMASAMSKNGGLGILNRSMSWVEQFNSIRYLSEENANPVLSIGVKDWNETIEHLDVVRSYLFSINIDVAHGYHQKVADVVYAIKNKIPDLKVIAGNVATVDGARYLSSAGADAIKIGIGPGSVCTTRTVTGVGVPQLTAIMDISKDRDIYYPDVKLIADGGIKNSGDIIKALAAGADFVMLGYLLAGHDECPGDSILSGYRTYRSFRGQSIFGSNGHRSSPEGIEGYVEARGPVAGTLQRLAAGVRSGMSYVGARNLKELRENAEFIRISDGTHLENSTRVLESING